MFNARLLRLCVAGLLFITASAIAAEGATKNKHPKDGATTRPTHAPAAKSVRGEIISLDVENKSFKIQAVDKQKQVTEVSVTTNDQTEITLDGELVSIADLKVGMTARITPDTGLATRVAAKSAPKQKSDRKHKADEKPKA